jgi:hypothetical protein
MQLQAWGSSWLTAVRGDLSASRCGSDGQRKDGKRSARKFTLCQDFQEIFFEFLKAPGFSCALGHVANVEFRIPAGCRMATQTIEHCSTLLRCAPVLEQVYFSNWPVASGVWTAYVNFLFTSPDLHWQSNVCLSNAGWLQSTLARDASHACDLRWPAPRQQQQVRTRFKHIQQCAAAEPTTLQLRIAVAPEANWDIHDRSNSSLYVALNTAEP